MRRRRLLGPLLYPEHIQTQLAPSQTRIVCQAPRLLDEVSTCWAMISFARCADLAKEMEITVVRTRCRRCQLLQGRCSGPALCSGLSPLHPLCLQFVCYQWVRGVT
jgi:hypothetical protein